MRTPERADIVALIGSTMMDWDAKAVATPQGAKVAFEALADRLINYFAVHYTAQQKSTLPGLPGGAPLG